ncbi:intermembrane lipid transfer protein VPS13B-like [Tachypleus tridentatus]|uniref:intermembrane lipid transfer protein VPS13B-like n=1 Tax=Tachypleus tridentatus TaxID=6853 RepID=UPI003FD1799A
MSLTPVSVYLEDTFFYKLFKLLPTFKPSLIHRKIVLQSREQLLPAEVSMAATSLSKPIHIHQFHIHPVSLMLSLRASLKLYLSLDHTPLHFHSFQRSNFFSSSYRLGHMLTMHYLSAALLRAGWVLGSMDLLANPAGFARAVSRGLTDFVLMPYRGLLRGPWAFVTGVSDGATSMIRQITSGALLSVTNWAGSVSRNMDRLSMDTDHWTRQETLRRHHPSGLVSGLSQGLSGFGISLLGAVAGVIDQPLQALVSPDLETNSPVRVASGVVTGVGKGLVGVVTKPIGGAAELVSQAGQGLLEGAGWGRKLVRKYSPVTALCRDRHNSHLKLAWKVLQGLGRDKVVLCVEATHLNHSGSYISDVLVLTSEVLCVINKEEDTQQQTFAITEVECRGSVGDLSAIYLAFTQESNLERVADYIHKTAQFNSIGAQWLTREDDQSEASFQTADDSNSIYQYYLHPKVRGLFLIQFHLVQREALGRGFRL